MNDFLLLKELILKHKSFLITTHVNPDADAVGSQLALHEVLKILGKDVRSVNHSATPYNLEFLDPGHLIEKYDEVLHKDLFNNIDCAIALDLNRANRVVKMENGFRSFTGTKICIDHHQDPENFTDYFFGGIDFCATGEILFDFIDQTKIVEFNQRTAELIYSAIMTDTGSFRFERTTPKVHLIAAQLLELGVNPTILYDKIFDQFKFSRIKLLGIALNSIQLDSSNEIAYMVITRNDIETTQATEADIDGFVNYCLSIQNVKIGILLYDLKDGIKISFRSKCDVNVNKLAKEFNGGGHTNASGSRLFNTSIDDVKEKVISSAQKYLSQ